MPKPDPYAHLHEQRLTGWIGEGSITAKLSRENDDEVVLDLNVASASVSQYNIHIQSLMEALTAAETWFASRGDYAWWRLGKKIERSMSQDYDLECREGAASITVKRNEVVLHLPGTVTGKADMIYHGFVSSKYVGRTSITNNVDLRVSFGQLRKVLSRLEVKAPAPGPRVPTVDADSVTF